MPLFILGLFIALPIIEIATFIQVGDRIGLWPTIAAVIATALAGTLLLRHQGLATLRRAQEAMARGEAPLREVFDGACLLIAGVLLLVPGFVTDAVGLLLFLPPVRGWLRGAVVPALVKSGRMQYSATFQGDVSQEPRGPAAPPRRPYEIEGEFREVDQPPREDGSSGDDDMPPRPGPPRA